MPRSSCDTCCNPSELARSVDSYRAASLGILCDILTAVSGGGGVEANVNIAQVAGTTTAAGNGVTTAGTLRVTLSSDSTGQVALAAGTAIAGKFGIDQTTPGTTNATSLKYLNTTAVDVSNGTVSAGTQRVTIASDSTGQIAIAAGSAIIGSVSINQTTPGTTNAVSLKYLNTTAVDASNGAVSAGTQRVTLASDSTGNIATIGTSVTPGTGAAHLGKAEDAAAASGDTGVGVLFKRTDTAAAQTDTTGDYTLGVANSFGAQHVNADSGFQLSANTGLLKIAGGTYTGSETTAAGPLLFAVQNGNLASIVNGGEGHYGPLGITVAGELFNRQTKGYANDATAGPPLAREDSASASGDYGVATMSVQQATPTNTVSADADYQALKGNIVGALYQEAANQVATYAASTTAGASGGVTTSGASVLTNSAKIKLLTVTSTLDVAVQISLDAGTTYIATLPIGSTTAQIIALDLGTNGRWSAANVYAKTITSNSASGSLYVGAII